MSAALSPQALVDFIDGFIAFYESVVEYLPRDIKNPTFVIDSPFKRVPQFEAELEVCFRVLELKSAIDFESDDILERGFDRIPPTVESEIEATILYTRKLIRRWAWDLSLANYAALRKEKRSRERTLLAADKRLHAALIEEGRSSEHWKTANKERACLTRAPLVGASRAMIRKDEISKLSELADRLSRHRPLIAGRVLELPSKHGTFEKDTEPLAAPRKVGEPPQSGEENEEPARKQNAGDADRKPGPNVVVLSGGRLEIDKASKTITLDEEQFQITHTPTFKLYLKVAEAEGEPVKTRDLKKLVGWKGRLDMLLRKYLLPVSPKLRATIIGSKAGHYTLVLPSLPQVRVPAKKKAQTRVAAT